MVTGISILVSGYIQLACGLQLYHWLIVVDLAFFSSVTHLTTLTCLRSYLQERPAIRLWRLISMGIIAVLLAVALGSTGYYAAGYTWPAQCFLTHDFANLEGPFAVAYWGAYGYNSLYMGTVLCFLALSYLSRVVQVFPSAQAFMRNLFRSRPSNGMQRCLVSIRNRATASSMTYVSKFWLLVNGLLLSMYCLSEAVADLYGSVLWEVCLKRAPLIWPTTIDHSQDYLACISISMGNNCRLA